MRRNSAASTEADQKPEAREGSGLPFQQPSDRSPSGRRSIVNAYWEGDHVVALFRSDDGSLVQKKVRASYSCFLKDEELTEDVKGSLRKSRHLRSMVRDGDFWRLEFRDHKMRRKVCGEDGLFALRDIPTYEADVHPVRRFLTDYNMEIAKPKRCYLDLETDARQPIKAAVNGKARVLSWALVREDGTAIAGVLEADTDSAERELLLDLWYELEEYEQVLAWGGDGFDFPVLKKRSERLAIRVKFKRWLWLDHLDIFKRYNMSASESGDEKQSFSLQAVSQALLGEGKVEFQTSRTFEMWEAGGTDRDLLVKYNVKDTHLMWRIEQKTGYVELHQTVSEVCNTLPDSRGANPTNFVDGYMLRLGQQKNVHFGTHFGNNSEGFEGAYVMEPTKTGLLKGVHVCDFASLYPSIIITFNISPETYCPRIVLEPDTSTLPSYLQHSAPKKKPLPAGHCEAANGAVFRSDVEGLLPNALVNLLSLRTEWKKKKNACAPGTPEWKDADRRSSAYKIAANSFYGVMGSPFSRFFEPKVAGATTITGQWLLKETVKAAEDRGYAGIYGDTDSVFIGDTTRTDFGAFVDWCNTDLYPALLVSRGAPQNRIKLSYEKEFSRIALIGKKRYAGRYAHYEGTDADENSKPEIKGLEYKRGDTLKLTRTLQAEVVDMLLFDKCEDPSVYAAHIEKWKFRVLEDDLSLSDITMTKKLSKPVDEYKRRKKKAGGWTSRPAHVELAVEKNKQGADIRPGDRIPYIVVDASMSPMQVIHADDFSGAYDRFYIWENLVFPATQRVLEACFPATSWKPYLKARPKKVRAKKDPAEKAPPAKKRIKVSHSLSLPGFD